jgi:hypothetical protein
MRAVSPRRLLLDGLLAVAVAFVSLGAMSHGGWDRDEVDTDERELDGVGGSLALLMTLPLAGRRLSPIPVFVVVALVTGMLYALGYGFPPAAFAIALYTVARWEDEAPATIRTTVLAGSIVVLLAPSLLRYGLGPEVLFGSVVWAVAWFAGDRVRQRRERAAAAAERARQAAREAERDAGSPAPRSERDRPRPPRPAGHAVSVILSRPMRGSSRAGSGAPRAAIQRSRMRRETPSRSTSSCERCGDVLCRRSSRRPASLRLTRSSSVARRRPRRRGRRGRHQTCVVSQCRPGLPIVREAPTNAAVTARAGRGRARWRPAHSRSSPEPRCATVHDGPRRHGIGHEERARCRRHAEATA